MPSGVYDRKKTPLERFLEKIKKVDSGCWEWQARKNNVGYSEFWSGTSHALGHRWSYEFYVGIIPDKLVIDHLCRSRSCVNPDHLEAVTNRENTMRGCVALVHKIRAINRTHCKYGHLLNKDNIKIIHHKKGDYRQCKKCLKRLSEISNVRDRAKKNLYQQKYRALKKQLRDKNDCFTTRPEKLH